MLGQFVWYELMTTDTKAAIAFYEKVIGWTAKDSGMGDYTLLHAGTAMVAGLMPIPPEVKAMGVPPNWTGYIAVDDVDAYARRVSDAGGSVRRAPEEIPGVGRFCVAADPHGAVFILFRSSTANGGSASATPGVPGHVGWRELHAGNGEQAFAFYSGLFGWTKGDAVDMGAMGVYQLFKTGGADAVGGMMTKPPQVPHPFWLYYFNVDALDTATTRVRNAGGQIIMEPMQVPGGSWIAHALDPQGAIFALVSMAR